MTQPDLAGQMQDCLLSILVPAYNAGLYLAECVASIVDQTPAFTYEIIILDDCSADSTAKIIEQFAGQFPAIIRPLKHDINRGISAARNSLMAAARGEYIWFVDADDTLARHAMQEWFAIVSANAPDICLCDFTITGKAPTPGFHGEAGIVLHDQDSLVRGVFSSRKMHFWSKVFRRSLWTDGIACPDGKVFEDLATVPWLLLNAESHYYCPSSWVNYRQSDTSIMARISRSRGFAERQNHDLATALEGYYSQLSDAVKPLSDETRYAIAHFIAKEFTKICHRLLKARLFRRRWPDNRQLLLEYRSAMEKSSPLSFTNLLSEYAARKQWTRYFLLRICVWIVR